MNSPSSNESQDVPSPIDLRDPKDAADWVAASDRKRPWRADVRTSIAELLRTTEPQPHRVLELGAGPGLLAEAILQSCALDNYTLFDFSQPMLAMSRVRLAAYPFAEFICGDFKQANWTAPFTVPFDAAVAMQAVHEIRHKRHVAGLYGQIARLLRPGGLLIVCDHTPPEANSALALLHSTEAEQLGALTAAGFVEVRTHLTLNGLYVCTGRRPDESE